MQGRGGVTRSCRDVAGSLDFVILRDLRNNLRVMRNARALSKLKLAMNLIRVIYCRMLRILGMGRKAQKNDSLPGSLDMLILRTLSLRDLHGYGIVQFIQQSSENELLVEEGSLYPALQRLELHGWIDGIWGVTSNNRRARIYKITAAGRKQLAVETRKYARLTLAIARVMGGA